MNANIFNIKGGAQDTKSTKHDAKVLDLDQSKPATGSKPKYDPKKYPKTTYTNEQIRTFLTGYIEVPRIKWADIPVSSHIRYLKSDGSFVRGGFVCNHWLNKDGKQFIHVANNFKKNAPGYKTWPVAHENVAKMYKKPDAKSGIEMDVVRSKTAEIIGQINKIVDAVKSIKRDVARNENDIKKIMMRLKI